MIFIFSTATNYTTSRYDYDENKQNGSFAVDKNKSTTNITKNNQIQGPKEVEFSMCAIIKDENNNLLEWTAYHYTMINLRHLILCNDLDSVSSPLKILDRWKSMIKVDVWEVNDFSPPRVVRNKTSYRDYVGRQMQCFRKCMDRFKKYNRTWSIYIDPDEYLTFNPVADDDDKCIFYENEGNQSNTKFMVYNESLLPKNCKKQTLQKLKNRGGNETIITSLWKKRSELPTNITSKTISEYIEEEPTWSRFNCHLLPRLQFGSKQETNEKILRYNIPTRFHAQNFTTLSFFAHGRRSDFSTNKWAKCIVDVSRLDRISPRNPHYMAIGCGGEQKGFVDHDKSLLRVNHYVGTENSFFVKNDEHRTEQVCFFLYLFMVFNGYCF